MVISNVKAVTVPRSSTRVTVYSVPFGPLIVLNQFTANHCDSERCDITSFIYCMRERGHPMLASHIGWKTSSLGTSQQGIWGSLEGSHWGQGLKRGPCISPLDKRNSVYSSLKPGPPKPCSHGVARTSPCLRTPQGSGTRKACAAVCLRSADSGSVGSMCLHRHRTWNQG